MPAGSRRPGGQPTGRAIRTGHLSQLSTAVRDLSGRTPASLRDLSSQHRAMLARAGAV